MKILNKVAFWMFVVLIVYPVIHTAKKGLHPEDVHSIGTFLGVVGAIYGVLAAFVIFVVWDQYNAVERATAREAGIVENIYRLSRYFSEDAFDNKRRLGKSIKDYLLACVTEWDDLALCRESEKAISALNAMETRLQDFQATNSNSDRIIYESLMNTLKELYACRDERIALAKHRMPKTLVNVLILLSAILILGFCALPIRSLLLGMFVVVSSVGILLSIFEVTKDMDNPFHGVWNTSPEPFAEQVKKIREI